MNNTLRTSPALESIFASFRSSFSFYVPQPHCFKVFTCRYFQQKPLKTHRTLPAQHQSATRTSNKLALEHSGAFSSYRCSYFPQELVETKAEIKKELILAFHKLYVGKLVYNAMLLSTSLICKYATVCIMSM